MFFFICGKNQKFKSMELNALLTLYIKMQETKVRPDTIISYKNHLPAIIRFFNQSGAYETKHIDQKLIDKFVQYSLFNGNKTVTINKRIGMLTAMLKELPKLALLRSRIINSKS